MNSKKLFHLCFLSLFSFLFVSEFVFSLDQIIRPFQSVRSSGMGNVRMTTGQYEENFFGNPARVTANPKRKWSLFNFSAETTAGTVDAISDLTGGGEVLRKVSDQAGENLHGRIQTAFPALYIPSSKISWAFGILMSTQFDVSLRRSFQLAPQSISDVGPAITAGKKFLEDKLSLGVTGHLTYRVSARGGFSFIDILKGVSLSPLKSGGEGMHVDFGTGATYLLPWKLWGGDLNAALAISNILGGSYSNLGKRFIKNLELPRRQYRAVHMGVSLTRESLWVFEKFMGAFEITDMWNNKNGSFFKLLHLGAEAQYGILFPRLGINQGYLTAGLGIDLRFFKLDLATYGEELSTNAGEFEDRRYALGLEFKI